MTATLIILELLEMQRLKWQYSMEERKQISHHLCGRDTNVIQSRQASEMWVHDKIVVACTWTS